MLNIQVRLYPNETMKAVLNSLCDYRRYCWNQGLELWNTLYEQRLIGLSDELQAKIKASLTDKTIKFSEEEQTMRTLFPLPSERIVRDELVAQKSDWQFALSSRVLQLAIKDLSIAWKLFFNNPKTANKPSFQSSKKHKQGFKTDSARIENGRLMLDKPHAYKGKWSSIRFYPSTQRCSNCGHVKTGDEKITLSGNTTHGTKHHEYVCYKCGYEDDRDHNAVLNLLALVK